MTMINGLWERSILVTAAVGRCVTAGVVVALAVAGCGGDGECAKIYDKLSECDPQMTKVMKKSDFIEKCQADAAKMKMFSACVGESSCEAFKTCTTTARDKERVVEVAKEIGDKLAKDDVKGAARDCTSMMNERFRAMPEFQTACEPVMEKEIERLTAEIAGKRDRAQPAKFDCDDLKKAADIAGGHWVAAADAACKEVEIASEVSQIAAQIERVSSGGGMGTGMLGRCASAISALEAIGTEWSKARRGELVTGCYLTVGKPFIVNTMKDPNRTCHEILEASLKGFMAHQLSDPEVDAVMDEAKQLCSL